MKINGSLDPRLNGSAGASGAESAQSVDARRAEKAAETKRQNADHASLSERARLLQRARTALEASSDVDYERVNKAREAVTNGTYKIDLRSLADKLMSLVK
ncbi:MAG: flagellar biosynthesis anti-sigma factor FlgM [Chloroflexi bacterium]|nr:flagellar biosynthesis anti-sigma factor FlgM [Chloroflexota bacterium]